MKEIWRDIPGWEGYYQASNLGRIKGLGRYDSAGHWLNERIYDFSTTHKNYYRFALSRDGKVEEKAVHYWIALTFLNLQPGQEVHHINRIKTDNRVKNLLVVTPEEHRTIHKEERAELGKVLFKGKHHTQEAKDKIRQKHLGRHLTEEHKQKIKEGNSIPVYEYTLGGVFVKEWGCIADAQRFYNDYHICDAANGKRKTAARRIWKKCLAI